MLSVFQKFHFASWFCLQSQQKKRDEKFWWAFDQSTTEFYNQTLSLAAD